jgi:hypothetical protein
MCAATVVIEVATSFVADFPASLQPARPLFGLCLSLLSASSFFFFRAPFFKFSTALLEIEPSYAFTVFKASFRFWPQLSAAKQVCFLGLFSLAIPKLSAKQLKLITPRLLSLLSESIESPFARVAESALTLLIERSFKTILIRTILPAVYGAIKDASCCHWSNAVRTGAARMLDTFAGLEARLFRGLARGTCPLADSATQKMVAWMQIADAASANGFSSGSKFTEIAELFGAADGAAPRSRIAVSRSKRALR